MKRQRGVIFFDYFLLHKQKKVIRRRATPDKVPQPQGLSPQNIPAKASYSCVKTTALQGKRNALFKPIEFIAT
jgi:hypothetical protein